MCDPELDDVTGAVLPGVGTGGVDPRIEAALALADRWDEAHGVGKTSVVADSLRAVLAAPGGTESEAAPPWCITHERVASECAPAPGVAATDTATHDTEDKR